MSQAQTAFGREADAVLLDALVARAGVTLACHYADSHEYEADVVAARRAAGAYGRRWPQGEIWAAVLSAGALVVLLAML